DGRLERRAQRRPPRRRALAEEGLGELADLDRRERGLELARELVVRLEGALEVGAAVGLVEGRERSARGAAVADLLAAAVDRRKVVQGRLRIGRRLRRGEVQEECEREAAQSARVARAPERAGDAALRLRQPEQEAVRRDLGVAILRVLRPPVGEAAVEPLPELARSGLRQADRDEILVDRQLPVGLKREAGGANLLVLSASLEKPPKEP